MSIPYQRHTRFGEYDQYFDHPLVAQNSFISAAPVIVDLPRVEDVKSLLPAPEWDGHETAIQTYWKVWELAFKHLANPTPENQFAAPYIDTAFWARALFMWDSSFIMMFTRYGRRAFDFQSTLDTFYAKQHPDGFISRQIKYSDGLDSFHRFDPVSTGPNLLAWAEWEHYQAARDRDRLARVFPVLVAYHHWLRRYRTWQDGSYWTTGWGCGMDNQPRTPYTTDAGLWMEHAHQVWLDATLQQILSARILARMAAALGTSIPDMTEEADRLTTYVNLKMWDNQSAFYYDGDRDGKRLGVKSIGAYWALLAGVVPPDRLGRFIAHLSDPQTFNRPHRIPALAADHPAFDPKGGYWSGGVWDPTNYMVLRGLNHVGQPDLAHEIALNHVANVAAVFAKTGTVWENYAADDAPNAAIPAKDDFVGWGGVGPVATLLEDVIGVQAEADQVVWRIRLTEAHGVARYPFGREGWLDLHCERRESADETPQIRAHSTIPVTLRLVWDGGEDLIYLKGT